MTDWKPGRWWRVINADGKLWCETSSEDEARARVRPADTLQRSWVRDDHQWRDTS